MKTKLSLAIGVLAILGAMAPAHGQTTGAVSKGEITSYLVGKHIVTEGNSLDTRKELYFSDDGSSFWVIGTYSSPSGTYKIADGRVCVHTTANGARSCFAIVRGASGALAIQGDGRLVGWTVLNDASVQAAQR